MLIPAFYPEIWLVIYTTWNDWFLLEILKNYKIKVETFNLLIIPIKKIVISKYIDSFQST